MDTPQIVTVRLDELKPHSSYARHDLSFPAQQMAGLEALGDLAFLEPIVIRKDRTVISGYERWQLARQQCRATILCIEYDLTEEESIRRLVQSLKPDKGQNAYTRVIVTLESEPFLQEKAQANMRAGGRYKGSSNSTGIHRLDVRSEMAAIAGVSTGNVTKVKQLRKTAVEAVEQAVRHGEISIHKAWLWSFESPERQLEHLRQHRLENDVKKKAKILVSHHQATLDKSLLDPRFFTMPQFDQLMTSLAESSANDPTVLGTTVIATLDIPGQGIFITRDLVEAARHIREDSDK
jgi:hypothetical protein